MLNGLQNERAYPVLILLDVYMPFIVTSGTSDQETHACYEAGANSCLAKPRTIESMHSLFKQVCSYWVDTSGPTPL